MRISVVSGGFDPLHSGHLSYLFAAAKLGEKLIVCLNSDEWLTKKKGKFFLPFIERKKILQSLEMVDSVYSFEDDEQGSCINGLKKVIKDYPKEEIIFCNGGDRNKENIPEQVLTDVQFEFSVGGDEKINSSSDILNNWQNNHEIRRWGKFFNLLTDDNVKVKELILHPGKEISFQRHFKRNEIWFVSKGECIVRHSKSKPEDAFEKNLAKHDLYLVDKNDWHQLKNPSKDSCHIIEIQYGDETIETDIERLNEG